MKRLLLLSPLLTALPLSAFTPPLPTHPPHTTHPSSSTRTALASSRLSTTPSTQPRPLSTSGDWSAYLDESKGLIYYFHRRTGESTWDPPPGVELNVELSVEEKKEMRERLRGYLVERLGGDLIEEGERLLLERDAMEEEQREVSSASSGTSTVGSATNTLEVPKSNVEISKDKRRSGILATHGTWIALIDEKRGMIYYHDEATNTTTWNRPSSFPFIKLSARKRKELQEINRRYLEWRKEGTVSAVKKVNVLGKGVVAASADSTIASGEESNVGIGNELDSLKKIQKDIDARLEQVTDGITKKKMPPIFKKEEWAAYLDDKSGLVYYHNEIEKRSVWDPPSDEFLENVRERMMDGSVKFESVVVKEVEKDLKGAVPKEDDVISTDANVKTATRTSPFFMEDTEETILARSPVDYDAAAMLAYDESGSSVDFDSFKSKYLLETTNMVARKHAKRMEEAARIADELKAEAEKQLEEVRRLAKSPVDYDAAARLSFETAGSVGEFDSFKSKYLLETSNMTAKKHAERMEESVSIAMELKAAKEKQLEEERRLARCPVDYDAAARLAFENAGAVGNFDAFKAKYVEDTSAMAAEKHNKRVERMKLSVAESAAQIDKQTDQIKKIESVPFFFLGEKQSSGASITSTIEQKEEVFVQSESASVKAMDEMSLNSQNDTSSNPPAEPEVYTALPKLPKDDPFASGSDVAALISPLKTETLYDVLQIETTATRSEIKRSYIALAKESHPDALLQNGIVDDPEADRRFNEIARAYKVLSDPTKRRRYDRELKAKGLSRSAGNMFENWVMGAAKAMDEVLAKAESDLENGGLEKKSP